VQAPNSLQIDHERQPRRPADQRDAGICDHFICQSLDALQLQNQTYWSIFRSRPFCPCVRHDRSHRSRRTAAVPAHRPHPAPRARYFRTRAWASAARPVTTMCRTPAASAPPVSSVVRSVLGVCARVENLARAPRANAMADSECHVSLGEMPGYPSNKTCFLDSGFGLQMNYNSGACSVR
jgi:hypothetical protein